MIVEHYLEWAATAPADLRAEAAGALARSYLHGELEDEVRSEVESVLLRSLDDPSMSIRFAIADVFAASHDAPPSIVLALAQDAPDIAEAVLTRSPLLGDLDLVDIVAQGCDRTQIAIAGRDFVSAPLSAAIAEVAGPRACEALLNNPGSRLTRGSAARMAARHGDDGGVRDALLAHEELGAELRQILMRRVASALSEFVSNCGWLRPDRANRAVSEACDRGALSIASRADDASGFIRHLADRGEFSAGFALRALLCGNLALFETALSTLSGQSPRRVAGFVRDFDGRGFEAVYRQAGFPTPALPAFRAALAASREFGFVSTDAEEAQLSRAMVERALTACVGDDVEVESLRALLRRFASEAAREDARRIYPAAEPALFKAA